MNRLLLATLGCLCLSSLGCVSSQVINVKDPRGVPVYAAEVMAVAGTVNAGPSMTNGSGQASLPFNIQGTKWIVISKQGYVTANVPMPSQWPLEVVMERTPAAEQAISSP